LTAARRKFTKDATILIARTDPFSGMKPVFPILLLVISAWCQSPGGAAPATPQTTPASNSAPPSALDENAQKAKALLEQAIQALGGQAYLGIRNRELQGRTYSMHHGQSTSGGVQFWSFTEFPDKERVELTKERDVTELFIGDKGYETTFRGTHPMDDKVLSDYLRRRKFSLDVVLRTWVNDPSVALFYDGFATAAEHNTQEVTLINSKDESVDLYLDSETHLPIKKTFTWRDPVDRQKNVEDEVYGNYRLVQGIMTPWDVSRYFNGDISGARFMNSVAYNQNLDPAMFDPNSGYNPNKPSGKH
jgi:hypothetical protein